MVTQKRLSEERAENSQIERANASGGGEKKSAELRHMPSTYRQPRSSEGEEDGANGENGKVLSRRTFTKV